MPGWIVHGQARSAVGGAGSPGRRATGFRRWSSAAWTRLVGAGPWLHRGSSAPLCNPAGWRDHTVTSVRDLPAPSDADRTYPQV